MQQPLPATFHNGLPATIGPGPSVPAPGASMAGMTMESIIQFAFAAANAGNNSGGGAGSKRKKPAAPVAPSRRARTSFSDVYDHSIKTQGDICIDDQMTDCQAMEPGSYHKGHLTYMTINMTEDLRRDLFKAIKLYATDFPPDTILFSRQKADNQAMLNSAHQQKSFCLRGTNPLQIYDFLKKMFGTIRVVCTQFEILQGTEGHQFLSCCGDIKPLPFGKWSKGSGGEVIDMNSPLIPPPRLTLSDIFPGVTLQYNEAINFPKVRMENTSPIILAPSVYIYIY